MNGISIGAASMAGFSDERQKVCGVVVGVVTENRDPQGHGRVKVRFPWLPGEQESAWAMIATLMAGKERGAYFLPEIDDQVLVAFAHGDPSRPFILGALWSKSAPPPETNADGKNNRRLIRSRSGLQVEFDDTSGSEKLTIRDADSAYAITLNPAEKRLHIESAGDLTIQAKGKLTLEGKEIEVKAQTKTIVKAGSQLALEGATTNVKGQPINLN